MPSLSGSAASERAQSNGTGFGRGAMQADDAAVLLGHGGLVDDSTSIVLGNFDPYDPMLTPLQHPCQPATT